MVKMFLTVSHSVFSIVQSCNGTPLQYSCLENPMDGGAWWDAVHGVATSLTRLSDFTLTFHFHALEKEMATLSCVLAWRIPGTREPGGLPSMGSHRASDTTEATQQQQQPLDSDFPYPYIIFLYCLIQRNNMLNNQLRSLTSLFPIQ